MDSSCAGSTHFFSLLFVSAVSFLLLFLSSHRYLALSSLLLFFSSLSSPFVCLSHTDTLHFLLHSFFLPFQLLLCGLKSSADIKLLFSFFLVYSNFFSFFKLNRWYLILYLWEPRCLWEPPRWTHYQWSKCTRQFMALDGPDQLPEESPLRRIPCEPSVDRDSGSLRGLCQKSFKSPGFSNHFGWTPPQYDGGTRASV